MKTLNITHVVVSLNKGGLERFVIDLINEQVKQGHNCQVICLYEKGVLVNELNIPIYACNKKAGFDIHSLRVLRKHLVLHKTEVIHTHNAVPHYYAVLAATFLNIRKIINTNHGMGNHESKKMDYLYMFSLKRTNNIVLVSSQTYKNFFFRHKLPPKKSIVINNGIPIKRFLIKNNRSKKNFLTEYNLPKNTILLGTAARLELVKDHKTMIDAFKLINNQLPETRLVIIGNGSQYENLRVYSELLNLSNKVIFLGERADVNLLLACLDIFILSSVSEGYSIALLEASCAGLPIVATDVGGNKEIVKHNKTGILVPAKNPLVMSNQILNLLKSQSLLNYMSRLTRVWVRKYGAIEVSAKKYETIYY